MKFMGIRVSSSEIRYAILSKNSDGEIVFENINEEHRLKYPTHCITVENKLLWAKQELERIFRQNPEIEQVILKTNEFGSETKSKRETTYVDAVVLLVCAEKNINAVTKLYSQIGTTSKQTQYHAENRVGRTEKYWNNTIADAVNCCFWQIRGVK